jgi:hypothetical protein
VFIVCGCSLRWLTTTARGVRCGGRDAVSLWKRALGGRSRGPPAALQRRLLVVGRAAGARDPTTVSAHSLNRHKSRWSRWVRGGVG